MKERESDLLKEQLRSVEAQWELAEKKVAELEKRDQEIAMGKLAISSQETPLSVEDEEEDEFDDVDGEVDGEEADSGRVIVRELDGKVNHEEDADGEEYDEDDDEDDLAEEDMSFTALIPSSTPVVPRQSRSRHSTPSDIAMGSPPVAYTGEKSDSSSPTAREGQVNRHQEGDDSLLLFEETSDRGSDGDEEQGNVFHEGQTLRSPLIEAYPDPGAPPPYAVSDSSPSPSARSDSIASSKADEDTPGVPLRKARVKRGGLLQRPSSRSPSVASSFMSTTTPKRRPSAGASASVIATLRATVERLQSEAQKAKDREEHYSLIREQLGSLTSHITSIEATNTRLVAELQRTKQRAEGTELLREEKRELERKVLGIDELRKRCAELEAKTDDLKR